MQPFEKKPDFIYTINVQHFDTSQPDTMYALCLPCSKQYMVSFFVGRHTFFTAWKSGLAYQ
jgi:hypothetical protein